MTKSVLEDTYRKSVRYAVNRAEHFQQLFDVDDQDLRLLLDAKYREKEYEADTAWLPEDEQYWEMTVYGAYVTSLESKNIDMNFDLEIGFEDTSTETFLDVVYPHFVQGFEDRYGDTVDELLYYPPQKLK